MAAATGCTSGAAAVLVRREQKRKAAEQHAEAERLQRAQWQRAREALDDDAQRPKKSESRNAHRSKSL